MRLEGLKDEGELRKVYFICEKRTKYIIVLKVLLKSQILNASMEYNFTIGIRQRMLMCAIYSNYIYFFIIISFLQNTRNVDAAIESKT